MKFPDCFFIDRTFALFPLLFAAIPAQAATLVNSGLSGAAVSGLDNGGGKAIAFTSGPDSYSLDSVAIRLTFSGSVQPATANVGIYSSSTPSAGNIRVGGTKLASFTLPTIDTGTQSYTLVPTTAFIIQPNTTYFFVIYNPVDTDPTSTTGAFGWNLTSGRTDTSGIAVAGGFSIPADLSSTADAQFGGYFRQGSETASPSNWTGLSAASYNDFQLNATLIPEPSSILLAGAGVIPIARRRRRSQS